MVIVEFSSVLEPNNLWSGLPGGNANEHNFVAQYVLVVEMRGLCYAGALTTKESRYIRSSTSLLLLMAKLIQCLLMVLLLC